MSGVEIHTNSVRCYVPSRGEIKIPIDLFDKFKETVVSGKDWIVEEMPGVVIPIGTSMDMPDFFGRVETKILKGKENSKDKRKENENEDQTRNAGSKPRNKNRRPRKLPAASIDLPNKTINKENINKPEGPLSTEKESDKTETAKKKARRPRRRRSGTKKPDQPTVTE